MSTELIRKAVGVDHTTWIECMSRVSATEPSRRADEEAAKRSRKEWPERPEEIQGRTSSVMGTKEESASRWPERLSLIKTT